MSLLKVLNNCLISKGLGNIHMPGLLALRSIVVKMVLLAEITITDITRAFSFGWVKAGKMHPCIAIVNNA